MKGITHTHANTHGSTLTHTRMHAQTHAHTTHTLYDSMSFMGGFNSLRKHPLLQMKERKQGRDKGASLDSWDAAQPLSPHLNCRSDRPCSAQNTHRFPLLTPQCPPDWPVSITSSGPVSLSHRLYRDQWKLIRLWPKCHPIPYTVHNHWPALYGRGAQPFSHRAPFSH